jgi:hypothetical protein
VSHWRGFAYGRLAIAPVTRRCLLSALDVQGANHTECPVEQITDCAEMEQVQRGLMHKQIRKLVNPAWAVTGEHHGRGTTALTGYAWRSPFKAIRAKPCREAKPCESETKCARCTRRDLICRGLLDAVHRSDQGAYFVKM